MKATLYEALGVPQGASEEEVRAALRRLIRKYYAKTRDGQGNVEEALRFINHASRILSDPNQRLHYDQELAVTTEATTEQRIAHFVSNVAATAEAQRVARRCHRHRGRKGADASRSQRRKSTCIIRA